MLTYLKIKLLIKVIFAISALVVALWGLGREYYEKNIKPFIK